MSNSKKIPVEELRDLKQLLDEGLITAAEFEEKKRQLLGLKGETGKTEHFVNQEEKTKDVTEAVDSKVKELVDSLNEVKDSESKDAFLGKLADSIAESFPEPYDDSAFVCDEDYGLTPTKPIRVSGIIQEESYLKYINDQLNKQFSWERTSSVNIDGMNGVVDIYEGTFKGEKITLYINPYGAVTTDTMPRGLMRFGDKQSGREKTGNQFALDKVRACIMSSPYANTNEMKWVTDFDLTYRSADIDSISPPFAVLWNNLEYYHSQKIGMNLKGLIVTFSDVVRVQALYKLSNAFAVMLAVFLESINHKQDLRPLTYITLPFAFWIANDFEELNGTINDKIKSQVVAEYNCFTSTDQRIKEYEEWIKEYVDESVLQEIEKIAAGKYMLVFGERLLNLCEEKKKIKEGFLGLSTKTVRTPDPQLRSDIAVFLSRAIPNFLDEIAPFIKPNKEGK